MLIRIIAKYQNIQLQSVRLDKVSLARYGMRNCLWSLSGRVACEVQCHHHSVIMSLLYSLKSNILFDDHRRCFSSGQMDWLFISSWIESTTTVWREMNVCLAVYLSVHISMLWMVKLWFDHVICFVSRFSFQNLDWYTQSRHLRWLFRQMIHRFCKRQTGTFLVFRLSTSHNRGKIHNQESVVVLNCGGWSEFWFVRRISWCSVSRISDFGWKNDFVSVDIEMMSWIVDDHQISPFILWWSKSLTENLHQMIICVEFCRIHQNENIEWWFHSNESHFTFQDDSICL